MTSLILFGITCSLLVAALCTWVLAPTLGFTVTVQVGHRVWALAAGLSAAVTLAVEVWA